MKAYKQAFGSTNPEEQKRHVTSLPFIGGKLCNPEFTLNLEISSLIGRCYEKREGPKKTPQTYKDIQADDSLDGDESNNDDGSGGEN